MTTKGNTAVMGPGTLLAQWLRSSPDIQERAGSNPRAGKMKKFQTKEIKTLRKIAVKIEQEIKH